MDSEEFTYWIALSRLEPIGLARHDAQAATICHTIAQANAPKGKKYKFEDFLLNFDKPRRVRDPKAIFNQFKMIAAQGKNGNT